MRIHVIHQGKTSFAFLCIAQTSDLPADVCSFLSKQELAMLEQFGSEQAKSAFLLGRYSAKTAILLARQTLGGEDGPVCEEEVKRLAKSGLMPNIYIENGIFGQPIIRFLPKLTGTVMSEVIFPFDVSIAHSCHDSAAIGASIVFDKAFPIGVDIENISRTPSKFLAEKITDDEIENFQDKELGRLVAWGFKEALSKVLKTGITLPLYFFHMSPIKITSDTHKLFVIGYTGEFEFFSQYSCVSRIYKPPKTHSQAFCDCECVLSIVSPKHCLLIL
ncbi:MAG: 4'-phosphopantetheinyl transferase superfamily protein [Holosporales bacterium]|nr:4'-phosphopantetheinyl transferase superfamily protein [Holosporales bacterium]